MTEPGICGGTGKTAGRSSGRNYIAFAVYY